MPTKTHLTKEQHFIEKEMRALGVLFADEASVMETDTMSSVCRCTCSDKVKGASVATAEGETGETGEGQRNKNRREGEEVKGRFYGDLLHECMAIVSGDDGFRETPKYIQPQNEVSGTK